MTSLTQGFGGASAASDFHIAFGVDSNYVPAMGACMRSIIKHNRDLKICFHVVTTALPASDIDQLAVFSDRYGVKLHVHSLGPGRLAALPEPKPPLSSAIYQRLLICEILHGVAGRVLYLDADIICLGDLAALNALPMEGKIAAAAADVFQDDRKRNISRVTDEPYFNSGVLYIDVDRWIESGVTADVIETLMHDEGKFSYPDQDALNRILDGKVAVLDKRWNLQFDHYPPDAHTVFLHYAGFKPWQVWSDNFGDDDFVSNLKETPWANWPPQRPATRKQRSRHGRKLLKAGRIVEGLYWLGLGVCTAKAARR